MAFLNVYISKPADIAHTPPFLPCIVDFKIGFLRLVGIWDFEPEMAAVIAQPEFVLGDKGENLHICDGVHISDDNIFFGVGYEQLHKLPEQGKRRICNDNIGLL